MIYRVLGDMKMISSGDISKFIKKIIDISIYDK